LTLFNSAEGAAVSRDLAVHSIGDAEADPFDGRTSREGPLIQLIHSRFPQFEVDDLSPILDNLQFMKIPREIAVMIRATQLAGRALTECMRTTKPGIMEYELDAVVKFVSYRNGAQGEAYYALIQSGPNAIIGHHNAGTRQMRDGDFLLMGFAPDYGYYMSDRTHLWPVNGKFRSSQRDLYESYTGCYRSVLNAIKPGITAQSVLQAAGGEMDGILAKRRFSKQLHNQAAKASVERFRQSSKNPGASLGHWVGMSTHDVEQDSGPLRPGMVFTIEPAFQVREERINIRCEDLIVIKESGAGILSDFVPLTADQIETVVRGDGMLQNYPSAIAGKK
jgi:Xaa-Pro aminopeptidase